MVKKTIEGIVIDKDGSIINQNNTQNEAMNTQYSEYRTFKLNQFKIYSPGIVTKILLAVVAIPFVIIMTLLGIILLFVFFLFGKKLNGSNFIKIWNFKGRL